MKKKSLILVLIIFIYTLFLLKCRNVILYNSYELWLQYETTAP